MRGQSRSLTNGLKQMRFVSTPELGCRPAGGIRSSSQAGAVLLEVVLALVLFVAAASILSSGLSSSLDALERLRLNTHAVDLAVSVFSELQMGTKSLALSGPQRFEEPLLAWTWEVVPQAMAGAAEEPSAFRTVEVIIRHDDPAMSYHLTQVLRIDSTNSSPQGPLAGISSF